ncbi:MAG: HDIG domain-containing protein, partial [Anaerolineales bacterium]
MREDNSRMLSTTERIRQAWISARLWLIFLLGLVGSTLAISIPLSRESNTFTLQVGDVAPQDILAPYALTFESDILTERARQQAEDAVPDYYDPPDVRVARTQLDRLAAALDFINSVRADVYSTREQQIADLRQLADIRLSDEEAATLLDLPQSRWEDIQAEMQTVLQEVMQNEIRPSQLEDVRRRVPTQVDVRMTESQTAIVSSFVRAFIAPNTTINTETTVTAQQAAREAIEPTTRTFAAGETIVNRGELVNETDREALEAFGLLRPPDQWLEIAINSLLVFILGSLFTIYAYRTHREQITIPRTALTLSLLLILNTVGMQLMIPGHTVLPYLFPAASLPLLLAVLFSPGIGIMSALVTGALAGYLAPRGLELALYVGLSGTMASLMIGRAERFSTFLWTGLGAGIAASIVVVIFRFPDPATDILGKSSLLAAALGSGMFSAFLGLGLTVLTGTFLGITTNLQLIELSRPDHPLLQLILQNSPGTYQHSLQVANLAEQAARAIGANPLLTRVGALYHDAGKALRPQFFIENQVAGQNAHDQLDPETSADVILSHVRDGLELARKYRLPPSIRAFITEHHGTMQTSYQMQQAIDAAGGSAEAVDPKAFTYMGPMPQSRETAILMLADGVEAKARADAPENEEEIDALVRWVIDARLDSGQLARTELTLKDLDDIRAAFVNTLKNIYHPRIRYPTPTPEAPETKKADSSPV